MKTMKMPWKPIKTYKKRYRPWNYLDNHENQPWTMKNHDTVMKNMDTTKNHKTIMKTNIIPWKTMKTNQ